MSRVEYVISEINDDTESKMVASVLRGYRRRIETMEIALREIAALGPWCEMSVAHRIVFAALTSGYSSALKTPRHTDQASPAAPALRAELAQACAATIEEAADVAAVGGSREIRLPDCLKEYRLLAPGPYVARSANDKLDDWPFWYVCGPSGENTLSFPGGQIFSDKEGAEAIARHANQRSAALTSEPRSAPHREAS